MNLGYSWTIRHLSICLASFVILTVQASDQAHSIQHNQPFSSSQAALDDSREKRNAEIELTQNENLPTNKRYIPYEELQKRLRHFIGKRPSDNFESSNDLSEPAEKRMRYFVGKRATGEQNEQEDDISDADEIAKRMRYFVGKRSRLRYFVGKRDDDDIEPSADDELQKRMRYFVGKRRYFIGKRRYFIGKRDGTDDDDDIAPSEKRSRLRYFVGKRVSSANPSKDELEKRMRYFVGKRDPISYKDYQKRLRYFVGKRDDSKSSENNGQFEQKRMRYFVG